MSKTVYSNLLSSVEILYITSLAENHADFAAYFNSKMIILMVRELSQTFPLGTFHMLKWRPILLNPAIILAVSFPNQVFPILNIPNSFFFMSQNFQTFTNLNPLPPELKWVTDQSTVHHLWYDQYIVMLHVPVTWTLFPIESNAECFGETNKRMGVV